MKTLQTTDQTIAKLISDETKRQENTIGLIPSENYVSQAVLEALGSALTNKYSEGYADKRYYQGNHYIDEIEKIAIERTKKLFGAPHVNVQPYSGSPANSAVYFALLAPKDKIMGLKLSGGGHLTHGHPDVTFSGRYFTSVQYDVDENGYIDMDAVRILARKEKPKIIVVGTTAYPRIFDWKKWREICDEAGALMLADISHIAGLVVGGVHPSPVPYADIVMFTTHKTLRGPRGAILLVTQEGLNKDPKMGEKIDKAVFPGLQGGPHDNTIAAMAVALKEAETPSFKRYTGQIVKNAQALAEGLMDRKFILATGGTDNHLMVVDLRAQGVVGNIAAIALEEVGIVVNRNSVPHDPNPPFYPSGIRLGTPAVTTRGMKEGEMRKIAEWIFQVIDYISGYILPQDKAERTLFMEKARKEFSRDQRFKAIRLQVQTLCRAFPIPTIMV